MYVTNSVQLSCCDLIILLGPVKMWKCESLLKTAEDGAEHICSVVFHFVCETLYQVYCSLWCWQSPTATESSWLLFSIPFEIPTWFLQLQISYVLFLWMSLNEYLMWITIIHTWILVYPNSFPLPKFRPLWREVWNISVHPINTSTFFYVQPSYTYLCCLNY